MKELYLKHQKLYNTLLTIISLPFILMILELIMKTIFYLGTYTGTFLRGLYQIVLY